MIRRLLAAFVLSVLFARSAPAAQCGGDFSAFIAAMSREAAAGISRAVIDNALAGVDLFRSDAERPDTYLCVLPLFHSFGQTVMQNGAITFGGTIVLQPRHALEPSSRFQCPTCASANPPVSNTLVVALTPTLWVTTRMRRSRARSP